MTYTTRYARTADDLRQVQRLRYQIFVAEMGAGGDGIDHDLSLEADGYDAFAQHLMIEDPTRASGDNLVGVYRLMTRDCAQRAGGFYARSEFDLSPLLSSKRSLLELGRSCVHPDYRNGMVLAQMWSALAQFVQDADIQVLFGTASFHGTDKDALAQPLSWLHHHYLAPPDLRVRAIGPAAVACDQIAAEQLDRPVAMRQMPPLIKSYLRLGGRVGQGAFVDHKFNTTDVCLILDTNALTYQARTRYTIGSPA